MIKTRINAICVFCGSRSGYKREFSEAAFRLGKLLAENRLKLVYGAGNIGLMGDIAKACEQEGGDILGVMPKKLTEKEIGRKTIRSYVITENMHERKKVMYMNSDAVIAMPGGIGTLEELFEIMTWKQLGFHNKPIYLLNVLDFWNKTLACLHDIVEQGFAEKKILDSIKVCHSVDEIFFDLKSSSLIASNE
tara:strand:- start:171 stop:746 length:576 start_codon:yes stop_codon:yes gene_type:complete